MEKQEATAKVRESYEQHIKLAREQQGRRRRGLSAVPSIGGETWHRGQARVMKALLDLMEDHE